MMHICHAWMLLISCGTVLMISEIHVQKHDHKKVLMNLYWLQFIPLKTEDYSILQYYMRHVIVRT